MNNADVTIEYVNELKCKVLASKEILYSLRNEYSFFVDGYKFSPKYKSGMWDGKIYMLDSKGLFYSGLLKSLLKTCKSKGLTIKVNDIHNYMPSKIDDSVIDNLLSYFKLTAFDYQLKSIKEALEKRKLLILSPTSSGKSFICAALYRYCIDNNIPLLITVPSTSLVEQLYSDFEEYMADDHNVSDYTAKLYSGQEKNPTHQVIISTWQSLMNKEPEWFSKFNFYICDECFIPTSKVLTKNGYVEIQNIKPGDIVINYSEQTKTFKEDTVVKVHKNLKKSHNKKLIKFKFDNNTEFTCTENHEILTNNGWKQAKYLDENDEIIGLS